MDSVRIKKKTSMGYNFIPKKWIPEGKDEYWIRDKQMENLKKWRHLTDGEVTVLKSNGNRSNNWNDVWVTDAFDPSFILQSTFEGKVRIGQLQKGSLEHHDLELPVGIVNSTVISCDIGDHVAIHNVLYLAHMIIGNQCLLFDIGELHTTHHAKFGNGILKEGESETTRIWIDVMNETGSRAVLPFDGMIPADAYLWARYRDDVDLQSQLIHITDSQFDAHHGHYGTIGDQTVIKHCRILKDVKIGSHCYIKGANKLKNVTINSNAEEPTQIGEGVELVNGLIGYGCHIFYGSKAVRFVIGNNSHLKYGARLVHSILGANSTISCCEVLNNLIFPAHEQHHNNSFLIASVVKGQSNMAAGATIGSNHNSRANDNEVEAGRGFWPGLCTSVKHSSRFASFTLLAKGAYPAELNNPFPFTLLNNNESKDQLEVLPAFWWLYNMYALARNTWKFQTRDKRVTKAQHIEFDYLAPDTVEEIITACNLLEMWTAKSYLESQNKNVNEVSAKKLMALGSQLLSESSDEIAGLIVLGENMEKSRRLVVILSPQKAYQAYKQMLMIYAAKNIIGFIESHPEANFEALHSALKGKRTTEWVNLGGQLCPQKSVDKLRSDIGSGKVKSWDQIHARYDSLWDQYPLEKQKHAYRVLCYLKNVRKISPEIWNAALDEASEIQMLIKELVYESRKKDFENPFKQLTFRNQEEMESVVGHVDENEFIQLINRETRLFKQKIKSLKKKI